MPNKENERVIRRVFDELLNGGNADVAEELISPDYVEHSPLSDQATGVDGLKERVSMLRSAFPDFHYDLEDLISGEDKAVSRWTMHGTHEGEFMGLEPTGRRIEVSGIDIYRISGGKVAEHWHEMDTLRMMQQLGAIPNPSE
ncbi:MAG: ester cyclase [Rubrobacteraceae bacterium]